MTFLATASGLMMERVRSTAILALRLNKSEEIQDYIMTRSVNCGAWASKTPGRAGAPKAKAARSSPMALPEPHELPVGAGQGSAIRPERRAQSPPAIDPFNPVPDVM